MIANVVLVGVKATIGIISSSIAVVLDAVNNLSDASSSVITIVGTKLANKQPDKKHPYGHGRIEFISAFLIAILILFAGGTSLYESIKGIITAIIPNYEIWTLIILGLGVLVKLALGIYYRHVAKKVNSDALKDSGTDALFDAIISFSTLIAAIVYMYTKVSLEAYLGMIISLFILKSGIGMLKNTISKIIGERTHSDLSNKIEAIANEFEEVMGTYDLIVNNYGPETYMASMHIEVRDDLTAKEIDTLTRAIAKKIYDDLSVIVVAIGIYSLNTKDEKLIAMKESISKIVRAYPQVLQMHGFFVDSKEKLIIFDIIIDFAEKNRTQVYREIYDKVQNTFPEYKLQITLDIDAGEIK
ncbi:MAG: cation diffusion facilitator family transporter [Clostridia bacterium]|nr:cation diffusion facilitator family transporter [Clostridia bacterium]